MTNSNPILGIVGGMGPLASAEFLKTIYEYNLSNSEQNAPFVVLYSDPTVPDRTEELLKGSYEKLLAYLRCAIEYLEMANVTNIVICCITIHHLIPYLSPEHRKKIVSLLDIIFVNVLNNRRRSLLICTNGTRKLNLFQSHPLWEKAQPYIVLPEEVDQERIHQFIYNKIKLNADITHFVPFIHEVFSKYAVDSFIAGCTEIHLLGKNICQVNESQYNQQYYTCIDPLEILATYLWRASLF